MTKKNEYLTFETKNSIDPYIEVSSILCFLLWYQSVDQGAQLIPTFKARSVKFTAITTHKQTVGFCEDRHYDEVLGKLDKEIFETFPEFA